MSTDNQDNPRATAPMASGNQKVFDNTKADSTARDRDSRTLVKDLPVGKMRPVNDKTGK